MEKFTELKILINQVGLIYNKYLEFAEYSGENFNIFNVLNISSSELTHSKIIGYFLNPKERHGQKDVFLKLFLKEITFEKDSKQSKIINDFQSINSSVINEKNIGNKNSETIEGGRIDILINDKKNKIIIENKIWAGDQSQQLIRYNNFDKNAPIIYLTLDGKEPSPESKGDLELDVNFVCISYKEHIVNWLNNCIKEMTNKPLIRETLNQYLVLIKQLTNQNNNNKMNQEILSIIVGEGKKENFENLIRLVNLTNDIFKVAVNEHLYPTLDKLILNHGLTTNLDREKFVNKDASKWSLGFSIQNEQMTKNNIQIGFAFNVANGANGLIIGYGYINHKIINEFNYEELIQNYEKHFSGKRESSDGWLAFQYFNGYKDWETLNDLKEVIHGNFKNDFTDKIETLLEIAENSF